MTEPAATEPAASEADALEQQQPVLDTDGTDDATAADLVPADATAASDEADEADRAEQGTAVPLDEDDYR